MPLLDHSHTVSVGVKVVVALVVDTIALSAQHFSSVGKCRQAKILKKYTLSSCDEFDT